MFSAREKKIIAKHVEELHRYLSEEVSLYDFGNEELRRIASFSIEHTSNIEEAYSVFSGILANTSILEDTEMRKIIFKMQLDILQRNDQKNQRNVAELIHEFTDATVSNAEVRMSTYHLHGTGGHPLFLKYLFATYVVRINSNLLSKDFITPEPGPKPRPEPEPGPKQRPQRTYKAPFFIATALLVTALCAYYFVARKHSQNLVDLEKEKSVLLSSLEKEKSVLLSHYLTTLNTALKEELGEIAGHISVNTNVWEKKREIDTIAYQVATSNIDEMRINELKSFSKIDSALIVESMLKPNELCWYNHTDLTAMYVHDTSGNVSIISDFRWADRDKEDLTKFLTVCYWKRFSIYGVCMNIEKEDTSFDVDRLKTKQIQNSLLEIMAGFAKEPMLDKFFKDLSFIRYRKHVPQKSVNQ
jgi:hypothetical protein